MGFFSNLKEKVASTFGGGKKSNKSNVELQYDKAMSLFDNANGAEAIEILEGISDSGFNDQQYKQLGLDALKVLSEFFENGEYSNSKIDKDINKAASYLEKYTNLCTLKPRISQRLFHFLRRQQMLELSLRI